MAHVVDDYRHSIHRFASRADAPHERSASRAAPCGVVKMRSAVLGGLLLGSWLSLAAAQQPPPSQPAPATPAPAQTTAQRYGAAMDAAVATPVCAGCHERQSRSIVLTAHGAKNDASGSMCQACHGDATEHMKDPTKVKPANPFSKLTPASAH